jgi:hypothetical protein
MSASVKQGELNHLEWVEPALAWIGICVLPLSFTLTQIAIMPPIWLFSGIAASVVLAAVCLHVSGDRESGEDSCYGNVLAPSASKRD